MVNYINTHGSGSLPSPDENGPLSYVDVNGDDQVAPVDVLLLINHINSQTAAGAGRHPQSHAARQPHDHRRKSRLCRQSLPGVATWARLPLAAIRQVWPHRPREDCRRR